MIPVLAITDRAKRYRAQSAVRGARRCVLCGAKGRLDVMHLDGNEANGDPRNLAYGCRSCNTKLAAAFKRIGAGVPTNQYNPKGGGIPTFGQYCWAVSQQRHSGEHGPAGAVIHATPKSKRVEYAQRIGEIKRSGFSERWNPMSKRNIWPFGAGQPLGTRTTHHRRASRPVSAKAAQKEERQREAERLEHKLSDRDLNEKLRRHYARGGTLAQFLAANPAFAKRWNPATGAFERCVEAVTAKGGAHDPRAVCAAAGRKKYGAKKFQAMAQAGRKRAGRNPYYIGVRRFESRKAAVSEAKRLADEQNREVFVQQDGPFNYVQRFSVRPGVFDASGNRLNPAKAAAEMSERFHGRPVEEILDVEEQVHYHEHLADLGELERLKVKALDGGIVTLTGFDGAILCSNEDGSQLYIRGGDQSVDPAEFAVSKPYHDKEDLGEVVKIWYFTTKKHLGSEGGTASYHHEFGEEDRQRGTRPRRPRLEYSTRDQRLSFSGGAYTVEPEGIKN